MLLCGLLACALSVGAAHAAPRQTARSKEKAQAEAQRAGIQQKLNALKKDISRTESEKEDAADELAESEEAISNANRSLRELAGEAERTHVLMNNCYRDYAQRNATTLAGLLDAG